jgi:glutamate 5-kinase
MERRQRFKQAKRVVVKVGTSLLTDGGAGLHTAFLGRLAGEVAALRREGRELILVTSGAIGTGMLALGERERPRTIPGKQALAAIGQPRLMQAYARAFARHRLVTAQVLLTAEDIHDRGRYSHARNALLELLARGVIPVVNENDTVAVDEIKFGDNDTLSAHVTNLAEADLLVILTDVAGLYTCNPAEDGSAELLSVVERIDARIEAMACGPGGSLGTGGMATKLTAAKMVTGMGEELVIADGRRPRVLRRILAGEDVGTAFFPHGDKLASRKRWIGFALRRRGSLTLDAGAAAAVRSGGKSLLPSGIRAVEGRFSQGEAVSLLDERGREFARGLVKYGADEVRKLCGAKTRDIEKLLGYRTTDEVVHRDDLVVLSAEDGKQS